jgi:HK97 family phage prohead protease
MEKIFNLTSTFKSHTEDDGSIMIRGMASTADFDRAGDSISADAWTKGGLHNFEKNPIILFNHDYNRPIGRATGLKAGENGLELTAKISKSAGDVAELVKDGVLGAFSVGFRVKDADYLEETDGLRIKDAELFEVSVVSVPCNQSATFSLAKSFDSMDEYEDFKKTFTNSDGTQVQKEIQMSEETQQPVDLEAFAKKVAEETAAKIAMKQAEQKAADVAAQKDLEDQATANAEAKAQQEEEVKTAIVSGVESGAERLMEDIRKEMADEKTATSETIEKYKTDLEEKQAEITAMQNSKMAHTDRSGNQELSKFGKELMYGHMLGVMTGKGWDTSYSNDVMQKLGVNYAANAAGISQEVSTQIEKEIMLELKLAQAFREITINSQTQVLPMQTDAGKAKWGLNTVAGGNLENRPEVTNAQYNAVQVILKATRLVSTTFMENNIDEEVLVNLMPMLVEGVARAHARGVDNAILAGTAGGDEKFDGLEALSGSVSVGVLDAAGGSAEDAVVTAAEFLAARKLMGKYGMMPSDLVYIVSQARYYDLLADAAFADITDVGSDIATKITGTVGAIYGTPVIVSDQVEAGVAEANGGAIGYAVNVKNFVIPRLRGVSIEQDYEVLNQRNVIVASQSLGFNQLRPNNGTTDVSVVALRRTDT